MPMAFMQRIIVSFSCSLVFLAFMLVGKFVRQRELLACGVCYPLKN